MIDNNHRARGQNGSENNENQIAVQKAHIDMNLSEDRQVADVGLSGNNSQMDHPDLL